MTIEHGVRVYDRIALALKSGQEVVLDFAGVTAFLTPFFTWAIGALTRDLTVEEVNRLLHLENLSALGHQTVQLVLEDSRRYHTDPAYREAVEAALDRIAEEM
jgi:hypothetical protein